MVVAAITTYGKCFNRAEGRGVKLERKNLEPEYFEVHDEAMELRNNYTAHSGMKQIEYATLVVILEPNKNRSGPPKMSMELSQPSSLTVPQLTKIIELAEHSREFEKNKTKTLEEKIFEDEVLNKDKAYWYSKAKT